MCVVLAIGYWLLGFNHSRTVMLRILVWLQNWDVYLCGAMVTSNVNLELDV
jgi:hypothetical protein